MALEKSLQQFGLTEKEARVYLATLELGKDSVQNISKKAGLKRPTTYLILDSLAEKGLVSKIHKEATTIYIAENPDYLISDLKEREKAIQDVLPALRTIYNIDREKPQIKFYEGKENIERIWIEDTFKSTKIDFITNISELLAKYPNVLPTFDELSKKKKFVTRELVTQNPNDVRYAKKYHSVRRQIRILPKVFRHTMDIDLYENKVLLVSLKNDFLVMIESNDVAETFRSLYELSWKSTPELK